MERAKLDTDEKRNAAEKLAVHFHDALGAANEALKAGAVTYEQWRALTEHIIPVHWKVYECVIDADIEIMVNRHIDRALKRPLRNPYPVCITPAKE